MHITGHQNARAGARVIFEKPPRALGENVDAESSHAQWWWLSYACHRILKRLSNCGLQIGRLSLVALLFVGSGMWILWADSALAAADVSASPAPSGGTLADRPVTPVNIAHRGGKFIAPENTIVGFQEGFWAGADVLEFDVHLTADGHLVVIHDDEVDRTTDGTGLVRETTLQEIKQFDAGYEFTDDGGETYPYRGHGITVPTLEEVYQAFPEAPVNVEIKEDQPGIEQALWQAIEEAEAADRTLVVARKMSVINRFREVCGARVATGSSIREIGAFILWSHLFPGWSLRTSYQALRVPKEIVTPVFVQAAHRSGLRVDVWIVNTEWHMRRLLSYGVDGIMTDHPDVLNRGLEGRAGISG